MSEESRGRTAAITGHRPKQLGADYALRDPLWVWLRNTLSASFEQHDVSTVISGLALGVDTLAAQLALDTSRQLWAYIPFEGQEGRWPSTSRQRYKQLRDASDKIRVVSEGAYAPWKMHVRNQAMVDDAELLIAVWNGTRQGGTFRCVEYALGQGQDVWWLDPSQQTRPGRWLRTLD